MSFLSNLIKDVAPVVATVAPFIPGGQAVAVLASAKVAQDQKSAVRYQQALQNERRKQQMAEIFGSGGNLSSVQAPQAGFTTQNAGFGAGFGTFLGDVGRNIVSPISNIIGAFRTPQNRQQPAITTIGGSGAQESQGSGSIQAGLGGFAGQALQQAGRFLRTPGGQVATGLGGLGLSMLGGDARPMRYPTKQVRLVKAVYNQTGRNLMQTSEILGIDPQNVSQMIMQKLPAPNPAPTASAIRKTRSTIRKLDRMCNLRDEIAKSAKTTTRRRAPMRRASTTTLIKN